MKYREFAKYLVEAPLYQRKPVEDVSFTDPVVLGATEEGFPRRRNKGFPVPKDLRRHCSECRQVENWDWNGVARSAEPIQLGVRVIGYTCRSCGKNEFLVWCRFSLNEGKVFVEKIGQDPKLEVTLPADFENALGDKRVMYVRGMTSRHNGYGIGALTYFRRLIEDTTNEMLDLLGGAMKAVGGDPAAIERLEQAKNGRAFEDKVKLAAKVLPAHLRPGGVNPFGDLHEALSIGLHGLTDEECCDIVDAMDGSLKFIYTQLKLHVEDARTYQHAAKNINQTVARLKQRGVKVSGL